MPIQRSQPRCKARAFQDMLPVSHDSAGSVTSLCKRPAQHEKAQPAGADWASFRAAPLRAVPLSGTSVAAVREACGDRSAALGRDASEIAARADRSHGARDNLVEEEARVRAGLRDAAGEAAQAEARDPAAAELDAAKDAGEALATAAKRAHPAVLGTAHAIFKATCALAAHVAADRANTTVGVAARAVLGTATAAISAAVAAPAVVGA